MPPVLRAFVAIPIPEMVTDFLQRIQKRLDLPGVNVRWVKTANIHLTLKFLGDIESSTVGQVADQLDIAVGSTPSFQLNASGFGVFPNRRQVRILWVGLGGDVGCLKTARDAIEKRMGMLGHKKERRRFKPHLTIGRARNRIDGQVFGSSLDELTDIASDSFQVDRIMLIQSVLKPTGAEYTPLHVSHLVN